MKANELMIGDIVRVAEDNLCIPKDTIVKIRAIDELNSLALKNGKRIAGSAHCQPTEENVFSGGIWVDYLEPIPLTEEIRDMVSCHPKMAIFWDDRRTEETGENWYELRICTDGDTALNMEIRYVHELQHALRLCGIDKEIKLED